MLEPIRVPNLQQTVIERIKDYILQSGLRGGDRLPTEEELAQQLGVSRTAVREALRALEALGIVGARQGSGRFVREFSFEPILDNLAYSLLYDVHTFAELLDVREKLEASFLEDVVERLTPETIAQLRRILDRMRHKSATDTSQQALLEEDVAFHRILYQPVGNSLLLKLLEVFWTVQRNLRSHVPHETVDREEFVRRHEGLVEALEARDVALARERLSTHFEGIRFWIAREKAVTQETARSLADTPASVTPGASATS